jgi:hypothetical protein
MRQGNFKNGCHYHPSILRTIPYFANQFGDVCMIKKAFVFVACGAKEHLDALHYSLQALKSRTRYEVWVVTDSRRNEVLIEHDLIKDIATPEEFDHHQASIYLKTSLFQILPSGYTYAYLDTDVVAVSDYVDQIFDQYKAPITFGYDHCKMPLFSPYAVNCGCKEGYESFMASLNQYLDSKDPLRKVSSPEIQVKRTALSKQLSQAVQNKPKLMLKGLKFLVSYPIFKFSEDFVFDRRRKIWYDREGQPIMTYISWWKVAKENNLKFRPFSLDLKFKSGQSVWINQCQHLAAEIKHKFDVIVEDNNWRHWNGGVFLFDDNSRAFLETWHHYTMSIFSDPNWRTRDQGTLIATVWKWGLHHHPVLDKKWNFICDYNNHLFGFRPETGEVTDDGKSYTRPVLLHVYHHFGDTDWPFWQWLDQNTEVSISN